ncbi:MAG: hypothetical protein KG003_01160 [Bacteroidetes bacterium]|nr:hypothetical protein [Bacteroidota bacterium]
MHRNYFLLILFVFNLSLFSQNNNALQWSNDVREIQEFQTIPDRNFSPKSAMSQSNWRVHHSNESNLSADTNTYWARFALVNQTDADHTWILELDKWTDVQLYINGDDKNPKRTGHFVAFDKKDFAHANYNLLRVDIQAGDTVSCLLRLEKSNAYFAVPASFEFKAMSLEKYFSNQFKSRIWLGLFLGFYLIMLAHNLFIYWSTKDHYYVHYLIILATLLLLTLHNFGYTVSLLHFIPNYGFIHAKVQFILSAILGVNMILFTQQFLHLKTEFPRIHKLLRILMILVILMPLPSFFGQAEVNEKISGMLGTLTMIVIMITAVKSWLAKFPSSDYFVVGYGAFSTGIVVLLLSFLGILPAYFLEYYPMNIGSSIEMIFFSIALGNRINLLARDNEEKQKLIITQLRANEELQTKVNRELDQKVKERTIEIEKQKIEIEEQRDLVAMEKKKSDELILNILPAATAEELKLTGKAKPQYYESASVLFADIVSFTKKAMEAEANEIVADLDYCFGAFDTIMMKYNMEKIKTIGDGYLAVGGIPIANESNPMDAIRAGMEMQEFMKSFAAARKAKGKNEWGIRIGIHTGPIIAGVVGKNKFAYDVWGDTVNTASRMESAGESDRVNVSESTYLLAKNHFTFAHRGKVHAKNIGEMDMYFVVKELN